MLKIKYQIKTLSPILLSTQSGDMNMTATLDYIPGSAILGVFAGKYIQAKNLDKTAHTDPYFYNWFLNSGIIFSNAYPCKETEYGTKNYFPAPLSMQTEKNDETTASDLFHKDSDEQMKTISGYCHIAGNTILKLTPSKSLNFHHARPDRIRGHSIEGQIFNYESIDPDQLFEGEIIGEEETLKEFVEELVGNEFPIQLGRSRTAQYGQAELKIVSEKPEKLEVEDNLKDKFILTFLSQTVLYNKNGFPSTSLDDLARYLSEALGIELKPDQIKSFKKPVEIENFISIWRLKRPSEVAFEAGSCFSIQIIDGSSKLIDLQKNGLGERRGEGFGRIKLNWWHEKDSYTVRESDEKKTEVEKPNGKIPELTARIFKEVLKENWKRAIERRALREYKQFIDHKPPTNSLLGRLEMMLKNAKSKEEFLKQIGKLHSTAMEKLEVCRGEEDTLLEFIKKGDPLNKPFSKEMAGLKTELENMEKEKGVKLEYLTEKKFWDELYKLYWLTFFRMMRKSNKKGGNE